MRRWAPSWLLRLPRAVVKALVEETSAPLGVKGTSVVGEEGPLERGPSHVVDGPRYPEDVRFTTRQDDVQS